MKIVVCIKSVIGKAPEEAIVRAEASCELNPFDRPALSLALSLRETQGGTVTAVSMGPPAAAAALYEAVALGVDRAVLVSDPALAGSDTLATSAALAAALKKLAPFDLCLFGVRSADSDTGQVGPQTAVLLELPFIAGAYSLAPSANGYRVERRADGFHEVYEVELPAALTVPVGAVALRDVPLAGIERAYGERIETWGLAELGLAAAEVGDAGSGTRVLSLRRVQRDRRCELMVGTVEEQAETLVQKLIAAGQLE